jgi:hypothetical protein
LELAEAHGTIVVAGNGLEIAFRQPRLVVSKNGWQADARDVTLAWKLRDRQKIVGSTRTTAAAVSSSFGAAEGVSIDTRGAELNGRVELHVSAGAKRVIADGKVLYDAALQADAAGLDAYSFGELSQSFRENCSAVAMAVDPSNRAREAARSLMQHGFSLAISKLAARSDDGSLSGDLNLELRPSGQVALATQLRSIGQVTLLGPTLTGAGQQVSSLRQFLRPIPGGMRASYSFDNGGLVVNEKAWSPILVRIALSIFDSALLAL